MFTHGGIDHYCTQLLALIDLHVVILMILIVYDNQRFAGFSISHWKLNQTNQSISFFYR